jgi:hypothetical protein
MCHFTGTKLSVRGFSIDASWITQAQEFPGVTPVRAVAGWVGDEVIVADKNGVLWVCGLPTGSWERNIPQPPTSIFFKQFLGGFFDIKSGDTYVAALDTDGRVWMIGNPTQGGQWVGPQNLKPPPGSGPFANNTVAFMCAFNGTMLQVCGIDTVARWVSAEQFPGRAPALDMWGYRGSLLVIDQDGTLWNVGLPSGAWATDFPQHTLPHPLKYFMGIGIDDNGDDYIAALDTAGTAWLIGKPLGGGHWVDPPHLTPPTPMAIAAKSVEHLHEFASGVMKRADHHAGKVKGAFLAILGGIIWRAEPDSIRIHQHAGISGNMIWARIGGRDYAFMYEHGTQQIEIRDSSQNGPVLHRFDDATPVADIEAAFRAL